MQLSPHSKEGKEGIRKNEESRREKKKKKKDTIHEFGKLMQKLHSINLIFSNFGL